LAPLRTRARRRLAILAAVFLFVLAAPGSAGATLISPQPSHSPNADDINTLYWPMLVVMVALIGVVNVALLTAVFRYRRRRGREPQQLRGSRALQVRIAGALAALAAASFVVSIVFTEKARHLAPTGPAGLQQSSATLPPSAPPATGNATPPASKSANPLEITATAQQWLWRYTYPNGAFSYYQLVVPVDTTVKLNLLTTDVVHGWYVPELGGKFDAVPGKTNHAWFRADRTGAYDGRSSTFSGAAYAADRIEVDVVTPPQYQSFVAAQKADIQAAQDTVVKQIQSGQIP
jgi:cytochrome c oxidase subunit 2